MKKLAFLPLILLITSLGFSQPNIQLPSTVMAVKDGDFNDELTFGGVKPQAGDNIVIPRGITVRLSDKEDLNKYADPATTFDISGKLQFLSGGQLYLSSGSVIYTRIEGRMSKIEGNNNKIVIGNATVYSDDDPSINGPLFLPQTIAPVSLLNFCVSIKNNMSVLNWSTLNELNSINFQVQRNVGGSKWENIATVPAAGRSNSLKSYLYIDSSNSSTRTYYRIKLINSSAEEVSNMRCGNNTVAESNIALLDASNRYLQFWFKQEVNSTVNFKLIDAKGKIVQQQTIKNPVGNITIKIDPVSKGLYTSSFADDNGFAYNQTVRL